MNMPGYGDPATWGPVRGPNDPRYEDHRAEECAGLMEEVAEAAKHLRKAIEAGYREDPAKMREQMQMALWDLQEGLSDAD